MLGVVLFIVAILGSILLHEAGHFATARWSGMKVHEFFVGFGPKLWSIRRGETEYGIKALPFGGYVKIAGMNPFEEVPEADRDRVYKAKPAWKRAIVLVAGSFMHFVIAFTILVAIFGFIGIEGPPTLEIADIRPGTPAAEAGFQTGDVVEAVDGEPVATWQELVSEILARPGEAVAVQVDRGGQDVSVPVTVGRHPDDETQGFLGIGPEQIRVTQSLPGAIASAGKQVGVGAKQSLEAFVGLFSPSSLGKLFDQATGDRERTIEDPASLVGIGQQTSNFVSQGNWLAFFSLVAAFNVFIGVANLIPLPPLDGGHLAVLVYEKIRGRDVDLQKLMPVTMAVILVLGSMFLLLLYLDIAKPLPAFQ